MLGIFLLICKIVGITIAAIIGTILIAVFLILFMPIKYSLSGSKIQENIFLKLNITYLNPIIRADILISDHNQVDFRILGLPIRTKKSNRDNKVSVETNDCTSTKNNKNINKKTKEVLSKITEYLKIASDYREQLIEVLKLICKAIVSILPKECNAEITFGTGQADSTGYICALYYAVENVLPKQFVICFEPVWLEKCLEGKLYLKGKVRFIFILIAIIKIIFNKEIRRFYKLIRSV